MSNIRIVADSTCDLTADLKTKYNITTIPLCIILESASYFDGEDITPQEIFKWSDAYRTTPKTGAVSYDRSLQILNPFIEAGDEIIFFGISGQMSETCKVIRRIAEDLDYDKLHVIDSQNVSTGIGIQVLYAAELAAQGKSAQEIIDLVEQRRSKVCSSFVVNTLTYLARGGRCSSATALFANAFKFKPQITVDNGSMSVTKKFHGNQASVAIKFVKELEPLFHSSDPTRIFIVHSCNDATIVNTVVSYLNSLNIFKEILITNTGGVISSHCGPDTLGIMFYKN